MKVLFSSVCQVFPKLKLAHLFVAVMTGVSVATSFSGTVLAQEDSEGDSQYLNFLYETLQEVDSLALSLAQETFSESENVELAQLFCSAYSQGATPGIILNELVEASQAQELDTTQQYALGAYWGAVSSASALFYCQEHLPMVQEYFEQEP